MAEAMTKGGDGGKLAGTAAQSALAWRWPTDDGGNVAPQGPRRRFRSDWLNASSDGAAAVWRVPELLGPTEAAALSAWRKPT